MKKYRQLKEAPRRMNKMVYTFGRMNPPTIGHGVVMKKIQNMAKGIDHRIYISQSQDPKKNPLDYATKIRWLTKMFPEANIEFNRNVKTIFDATQKISDDGYKDVTLVVGSDRVAEFKKSITKYIGTGKDKLFKFTKFKVVSAGSRDPDAQGAKGMSASKMREAVSKNDLESFKKGIPPTLNNRETKMLFNKIRMNMGLKEGEIKEMTEENYIVGDIVENQKDGSYGIIISQTTEKLVCEIVANGGLYQVNQIIKEDKENFVKTGLQEGVNLDRVTAVHKRQKDSQKQDHEDERGELKDRQRTEKDRAKVQDQVAKNRNARTNRTEQKGKAQSILVKYSNDVNRALASVTPLSVSKAKMFIDNLDMNAAFRLFTALNEGNIKKINTIYEKYEVNKYIKETSSTTRSKKKYNRRNQNGRS